MVAGFNIPNFGNAIVKVPDTGRNESARPEMINLGRYSDLAATVSIPSRPPPAANVIPIQSVSSTEKRKTNDPEEGVKKLKLRTGLPRVIQVNKIVNTTAKLPKTTKAIPVTIMAAGGIPNNELQRVKNVNAQLKEELAQIKKENERLEIEILRRENEKLRQENDDLRKQLSLIKQLIRAPERLKSVLKRLKERAASGNERSH